MKTTPLAKKFVVAFATLLVVIAFIALPNSPAHADGPGPSPLIPGVGKVSSATLHTMFMREKSWYDSQTRLLYDASNLSNSFQSLIDFKGQKKYGLIGDVTGLESALATFNEEIEAARIIHAETGRILGTNSGFDATFYVVDPKAASMTFVAARDSLKAAHFKITNAMAKLEKAYYKWRKDKIELPE